MIKWTQDTLEASGYKVENCKITDADLMVEQDRLQGIRFSLIIEGESGGCIAFGGYKLGHMEFNEDPRSFTSDERSMVFIMNIFNLTGATRLSELPGKYIRAAYKGNIFAGIVGNIVSDKWFDFDSFWNEFEKDKIEYEEECRRTLNYEEDEDE